jgi:hypothetical protein
MPKNPSSDRPNPTYPNSTSSKNTTNSYVNQILDQIQIPKNNSKTKNKTKNPPNNKSNKNSQSNTTIHCTKNMLWLIYQGMRAAKSGADGGQKNKLSRPRDKRFVEL